MSIRSKIGAIVLLLTLVTAATVVTTYMVAQEQESYGAAINLAGKQRMLSQKLMRLAFSLIIVAPDNPSATKSSPEHPFQALIDDRTANSSLIRNQLRESMNQFEENLDLLWRGGTGRDSSGNRTNLPPSSAAARIQLNKLRRSWENTRGHYAQILEKQDIIEHAEQLNLAYRLNRQSVNLLAEAEWLTSIIENDSRKKVQSIKNYQIGFLIIAFCIAGLAWLFSRRAIARPLEMLSGTVLGIRSGNLASRSGLVSYDEIGSLAQGINEMAASLEAQHLERLHSEAALRESEEQARSIIRLNPDVTIIIDDQGLVHTFNPAAENVFGYQASEVIGRNIKMLMPDPYHSEHDGYLSRYREGRGGTILNKGPAEVRGRRKDGSDFPIELAVTELWLSERRHFLGSIRDISGRKQAELALEQNLVELQKINLELQEAQQHLLQSEKMASIGQLAAGVAHEINNPIGYINSNIGTLKQYVDNLLMLLHAYEQAEASISDAAARSALLQIKQDIEFQYLREDLQPLITESQEGVARVKRIVQDLKDFSHVDEAEWQYADLHKGIDSTLNIVSNELKYKADIIREYGALPKIECIISQLNQVFMNLLVNAAHAIEKHGTITIRTGMNGPDWAWVSISDTGKGIAKENLIKIFDPFFTTKPVGSGTGLGLSLSFGIVEKHGGHIDVETEEGKGTTFTVVIPVHQTNRGREE